METQPATIHDKCNHYTKFVDYLWQVQYKLNLPVSRPICVQCLLYLTRILHDLKVFRPFSLLDRCRHLIQ